MGSVEVFFCPNGHEQYFSDLSDEEKLQKENDALKSRLKLKVIKIRS